MLYHLEAIHLTAIARFALHSNEVRAQLDSAFSLDLHSSIYPSIHLCIHQCCQLFTSDKKTFVKLEEKREKLNLATKNIGKLAVFH